MALHAGLLVVAKDAESLWKLGDQFKAHTACISCPLPHSTGPSCPLCCPWHVCMIDMHNPNNALTVLAVSHLAMLGCRAGGSQVHEPDAGLSQGQRRAGGGQRRPGPPGPQTHGRLHRSLHPVRCRPSLAQRLAPSSRLPRAFLSACLAQRPEGVTGTRSACRLIGSCTAAAVRGMAQTATEIRLAETSP